MSSNLAENLHIFEDKKILTVTELSLAIKSQIENNFPSLWLQGEVSGLNHHSSGNTYLSLKDNNNSVIDAVCWRGTKLGITLEDGMEIVAKGRVTTYPARSRYQFIIEEANIAGEGALLKLLNERKKLFEARGYFANKRPIPKFPEIIGIVTSKTGAVLQDMRHRLEDRYPFCHVVVWPVNVQGAESAEQIASAVRGFNLLTDKRPDILIVARGGGSIEDLWSFNEEVVVRAVFESKIPVISAIGHETDTTLIDYAADLRAPTPTAAIELTTPVLSEVKSQFQRNMSRMRNLFENFAMERTQRFDDKSERLILSVTNYLKDKETKLEAKKLPSLYQFICLKRKEFERHSDSYNKLSDNYFQKLKEKITILGNRLEQASFLKILAKGFCFITGQSGNTIETKTAFENARSDDMTIHFQDGNVKI